jgi:sulfite reductase beta subunit-like hemoprotein
VAQPAADHGAIVAAAPLGRLTAAQVRAVLTLLRPGEVMRIGIAGRLVIPLAGPAGPASDVLAGLGLAAAPGDPMAGVTACSGTACVRSLADVRSAARPVSGHAVTHWAGCARSCGRPPDAAPVVALDASRYRLGEEVLT